MTVPPPPPPDPPPPGPPSGRRDNGLPAADWGALVDLDPRLGEHLLDSLAAAGVPAYVEPASAADPFSRAPLPSRPLDRLWVDPDRAEQARAVVAAEVRDLSALLAEVEPGADAGGLVQPVPRHAARRVLTPPPLPDPPPRTPRAAEPSAAPPPPATPPAPAAPAAHPAPSAPSDDEVFAQIVAGFDRTTDDPVPRWPVLEDTDLDAARHRPPPVDRGRPPRRRRDDPPLPEWLEPAALDPDDADDDDAGSRGSPPDRDHYVPPPPPPAPRVRPRTLGAIAVLLLGLVLVFAPSLVDQPSSPGTVLLGAALLVGGAGVLVWSVRDAPHGDGPDDGAVV